MPLARDEARWSLDGDDAAHGPAKAPFCSESAGHLPETSLSLHVKNLCDVIFPIKADELDTKIVFVRQVVADVKSREWRSIREEMPLLKPPAARNSVVVDIDQGQEIHDAP